MLRRIGAQPDVGRLSIADELQCHWTHPFRPVLLCGPNHQRRVWEPALHISNVWVAHEGAVGARDVGETQPIGRRATSDGVGQATAFDAEKAIRERIVKHGMYTRGHDAPL